MNKNIFSENIRIVNNLNNIVEDLREGNLSVFAGAGLSVSAGYADWKGLLRPIINQLGVNPDLDLTLIAQYYKEKYGRHEINRLIFGEFNKDEQIEEDSSISILSELPIKSYWTTNYDGVIENALTNNKKTFHVIDNINGFKYHKQNCDALVYKMHGDKDRPDEAVITKFDYETYDKTRALFSKVLSVELVTKTFLFIGFSFSDPNLDRIISIVKHDFDKYSSKTHYCFMRAVRPSDYISNGDDFLTASQKEHYYQDLVKQDLRIEDMREYGIQTILVNDFSQIKSMLEYVRKRFVMNKVFVSGTYDGNLEYGHADAKFIMELSKALVKNNYEIVSGFGNNIGNYLVLGAYDTENQKTSNKKLNEVIKVFPIQSVNSSDEDDKKAKSIIRESLIKECGFFISMFGKNKYKSNWLDTEKKSKAAPKDKVISTKKKKFFGKNYNIPTALDDDGMFNEFEIAVKHNNIVVPLGFTNNTSKYIYDICSNNKYNKISEIKDLFEKLSDDNQTIGSKVNLVIKMLELEKIEQEHKMERDLMCEFSKKKIFLSFHYKTNHKNIEKIRKVINASEHFVAIEKERIKGDEQMIHKWIDKRMKVSEITVLLLNGEFIKSQYLLYELDKSCQQNNPMIVLYQEDDLTPSDKTKFNKMLKKLNYTNYIELDYSETISKNKLVDELVVIAVKNLLI